ncbi:hypothetical protein [Treponema brennaborense]|uniref:DinB-like domain-containing protein n=1 Tax=Treponema brennaborense (strain DSM 12168 / CIP 105900 / DD5/3) TaxID=906968 RepID=F4LKS4_TREBD|nr:hypothetical protein [Treponema brennaborense]AEE15535.1 hypothetical protein Trebr_0079 [Treponema brennaborense DSM 12168]
MKENYIKQFEQFYRMFSDIVNGFSDDAWVSVGHKLTVPQKLSFHILQSTKFYMTDTSNFEECNGNTGLCHDYKIDNNFSIKKEEIIINIKKQYEKIKNWIENIDLNEKNEKFPWTGKDIESVVIFISRHSYYHLGELNCLLNENLLGEGDDFFAHNIW